MSVWELLIILVFTAAGATIHASVGLGIGLVAGPVLIAVDPAFLPGPTIMATLLLTGRHLLVEGRHADRETIGRAALGVPVGLAVGLAVVALADDRTMRIVIGSAIVIAAAVLLLGVHVTRTSRTDVTGGGVYGLGMITAGVPGPAAAVAFNDLPPSVYRGTMGYMGTTVGLVSLVLLAAAGQFGAEQLVLAGLMVPGVAVGLFAARWVRPALDRAWFRPVVLWLAAGGGAVVAVGAFTSG
ncbi:MAG: sulfite exporter TauE/SafE family protein [Actinomycetota bacterium]